MKKLFYFLLLASAISMTATGCSKDDNSGNPPDGPAGNVEMLYGTWGSTHMWGSNGLDQDIDASVSTFTFLADGSFSENQGTAVAHGDWTYNPAARELVLSNPVSVINAHVTTLTATTLIMSYPVAGIDLVVVTYSKMGNRAPMQTESINDSSVAPMPILSSIINLSNF
ncbi:MAG: hypothetical protein RR330_03280 [Alistipes sp.]